MSNLLYNLAQPFSDTKQYTQGTIVVYNDRMYEMTASDYTPGAFNPEKFTERFLSEMMSGKLNSNLMLKEYFINGTFVSATELKFDLSSLQNYQKLTFGKNAFCYLNKYRASGGCTGINFSYTASTGILIASPLNDGFQFWSGSYGSYDGTPQVCILM